MARALVHKPAAAAAAPLPAGLSAHSLHVCAVAGCPSCRPCYPGALETTARAFSARGRSGLEGIDFGGWIFLVDLSSHNSNLEERRKT